MELFDFKCRPTMAWLTVNRDCNFRCQWCYGEDSHYEPKDTMSFQTAKKLVKTAFDAGAKHFCIIGGEPTLWPYLFELNKFCKDLGVTTGLITNAERFGNDDYWDQYLKNPCDGVSVSIKSADREQFKMVTKSNLFDKTMVGVERAIKHCRANISTVYNSLVGMDGLKNIAVVSRELGAEFFVVDLCSAVISDNDVSQGFAIEPHQLAKDIMEMQPFLSSLYNEKIKIGAYIPLCLFPESFVEMMIEKDQISTMCHVYGRQGINFDTNGDVIICNQLLNSVIAENGTDYIDGSSLLSHLNNDNLREDYEQLLRYPADACGGCRWKMHCRGGCLLNWMIFDSSICHTIS